MRSKLRAGGADTQGKTHHVGSRRRAILGEKRHGGLRRTRAIMIYPMNALANSQVEELDKSSAHLSKAEVRQLRGTFRFFRNDAAIELLPHHLPKPLKSAFEDAIARAQSEAARATE